MAKETNGYGRLRIEVEVRNARMASVPMKNKKTGASETWTFLEMSCETLYDHELVTAQVEVPKGTTKDNYTVPFGTGDKVLLFVGTVRWFGGQRKLGVKEVEMVA